MLMCIYFPDSYIPTYLITYSLRGHCLIHNDDMMFHSKLQNNIISKNVTGLNGFTADQLQYAVKHKSCHCHLMVDVVNKQPVIKILILKLLRMI